MKILCCILFNVVYNPFTVLTKIKIAVKTLELENQKLDIKLSRGMIISEMLCWNEAQNNENISKISFECFCKMQNC